MQRIFNMLIQNLTNMGNSITEVNFWDDFVCVKFSDGERRYSVNIQLLEEDKKDGN